MDEAEKQKKVAEAIEKMDALVASIQAGAEDIYKSRTQVSNWKAKLKAQKETEGKEKTDNIKTLDAIDRMMDTMHVFDYIAAIGDKSLAKKWLKDNPEKAELLKKAGKLASSSDEDDESDDEQK